VLYREPMWLKSRRPVDPTTVISVSVLYREPMWLKYQPTPTKRTTCRHVSVLYREPMWLKYTAPRRLCAHPYVSVLYREPMWLKSRCGIPDAPRSAMFQCSTVSRCG